MGFKGETNDLSFVQSSFESLSTTIMLPTKIESTLELCAHISEGQICDLNQVGGKSEWVMVLLVL